MSKINPISYDKTPWRKSSRSVAQSNCIEVAKSAEFVGVRDSRNPDKNILLVTSNQWQNLIQVVTRGSLIL